MPWSSGDSLNSGNLNTTRPSWSSIYPYCDAKQFGATGDGTTDDTAALQSALNYGAGQHVPVFLSDGTYKITSPLSMLGGVNHLHGAGVNKTYIRQASTNTAILQLGYYDKHVTDLTLDYASRQTQSSANNIEINALSWGVLERLQCLDGYTGIMIPQKAVEGSANYIASCSLRDIYISRFSYRGLDLRGYSGGNSGCVMDNIYILPRSASGVSENVDTGAYFGSWTDGVINQLNVEAGNPLYAIQLESCPGLVANSLHFESLTPRQDNGAFVFFNGSSGVINGMLIDSCSILSDSLPTEYGLFRVAGTSNLILNNVVERNATDVDTTFSAFLVTSTATDARIYASNVTGTGLTGTGTLSDASRQLVQYNDTFSVGSLALAQGTATAPALSFGSETSLGLYRSATSTIAQSYGTLSIPILDVGASGEIYGTGTQLRVNSVDHSLALLLDDTVLQTYGVGLDLNQQRLTSIKSNAANSALFATLNANEFAIGVGVSNATLMWRSGNTAYVWGTSSTTSGA